MSPQGLFGLIADINQAFTPGAPIDSMDLFAGRRRQVQKVIATIFQRGQHVVLFGERGVGKTSLARTLYDFLVLSGISHYQIARVNCAEGMDFETIWKNAFKQFVFTDGDASSTLDDALPENPNSESIRETFQLIDVPSIVIFDEFDRLEDDEIERLMADTIKSLSDNTIRTTLIFVGIADSVDQLIGEHPSTERAIVQVPMPRMSKAELLEIVDKGLARCKGMSVDPVVRGRLADFAHGLPTYTHLLTREAATAAAMDGRLEITMDDLQVAFKEATESHLASLLTTYNKAVASAKGVMFAPVLLACALAIKDEKGYFYANAVVSPLCSITQGDYKIPAFAKHLKTFTQEPRGLILESDGRRRYRFVKPIMEPYVILRGLADGLISESQLSQRPDAATGPVQLSLRLQPFAPESDSSPALPPAGLLSSSS